MPCQAVLQPLQPGAITQAAQESCGLPCLPSIQVLDEFEGDEYYKQPVTAELAGGGSTDTIVYLWQDSLRPLLYGEWDPEQFRCDCGCLIGLFWVSTLRTRACPPHSVPAVRPLGSQSELHPSNPSLPTSPAPLPPPGSASWGGM